MNDWNTWKQSMRVAIQAASIARQYHDTMARDHFVVEEDMSRFADVAAKLADLWESTLPK